MVLPATPRDPASAPAQLAPLEVRDLLAGSLPLPLTSLIGREGEIASASALLSDPTVRLVTLTGSGGVGKTRLALRAAEAARDCFADGRVFVPLASIVDPDLVAPAVAQTLGIREARNLSAADRLVDVLRERQLLLILDNFEQVIDAAPVVVSLLSACPRLTILATSRAPLRVSGEHVIEILPLSAPVVGANLSVEETAETEAVKLFVARASAVRHDFVLTEENAADVAEIVRRVEGLPLAIELAAARLAHLSPASLIARMESRLPLLTGGERDLPERQRTMSATIAWSYDLLTAEQQQLFRHLAVFVGGFTLEAAATVMSGVDVSDIEVLNGVGSLVAMSLIRQEDDGPSGSRYVLLEMVREYGRNLLVESGEHDPLKTRHAKWCVEFAEQADPAIWGGPDHAVWLDRLEIELPNFRAALQWLEESGDDASLLRLAAALGGLWNFRSYRLEGRDWLEKALASGDENVPAARGMALIKLAVLNRALGNKDVEQLVQEGLAIRRQLDDQRAIARSIMFLGFIHLEQGRSDRALEALAEAEEIVERLGESPGLGRFYSFKARIALRNGNKVEAHQLFEKAAEHYERDGFAISVAEVRLSQGRILSYQGEVKQAAFCVAESLHRWSEFRSKEVLIEAVTASANLGANAGEFSRANRLLGFADALGERLGYADSPSAPRRNEPAQRVSDDESFLSEWQAGRSLPIPQAIDEALALLAAIGEEGSEALSESAQAEPAPTPHGSLTRREQEVLRLVASGRSNREIASLLHVSERTIENHVHHILGKFDLPSRTAATRYAVEHGLA